LDALGEGRVDGALEPEFRLSVIPAAFPGIPGAFPVIPAAFPVIPAKAGIQRTSGQG
jgi:hypothetical protein